MRLIFVIMILSLGAQLEAGNYSVGIDLSDEAGISVQRKASQKLPYLHLGLFHKSREFLIVDLDGQKHLSRHITGYYGSVYAGGGVRITSEPRLSNFERYQGRVCLGTQLESVKLGVEGFLESSVLVGPLPTTTLSQSHALGLRMRI